MSKLRLFSVTIKDCRVDTFTVGGHGGAGKDTSNTGVRVTHEPSGGMGKASDTRSQTKNKSLAFGRMARSDAFQLWAKLRCHQVAQGPTVAELVEDAMKPENLKVEVFEHGKWKHEV